MLQFKLKLLSFLDLSFYNSLILWQQLNYPVLSEIVPQQATNIIYKTVENSVAGFLLGFLCCLWVGIFYFKVPEKWDAVSDALLRLEKRDRDYKNLCVKLAKEGVDLKEFDTDRLD